MKGFKERFLHKSEHISSQSSEIPFLPADFDRLLLWSPEEKTKKINTKKEIIRAALMQFYIEENEDMTYFINWLSDRSHARNMGIVIQYMARTLAETEYVLELPDLPFRFFRRDDPAWSVSGRGVSKAMTMAWAMETDNQWYAGMNSNLFDRCIWIVDNSPLGATTEVPYEIARDMAHENAHIYIALHYPTIDAATTQATIPVFEGNYEAYLKDVGEQLCTEFGDNYCDFVQKPGYIGAEYFE